MCIFKQKNIRHITVIYKIALINVVITKLAKIVEKIN
jgi:hypothetical protein